MWSIALQAAQLTSLLIVGLLCVLLLHKVRKIHKMMHDVKQSGQDLPEMIRRESTAHFQQTQLLPDLYAELGMARGLPALRGWAASPDFLLVLARHVKNQAPQQLLECGSGASTVVLARCLRLQGNGHLYSLDHDPDFAAATRRRLAELDLDHWATVLDASLTSHRIREADWRWYSTESLPNTSFDMIVVDGPPVSIGPLARYPAGPILLPRLSANGHCFMDDMIRNDETEIVAQWLREFPHLTRQDYHCEKGCVALFAS